MKERPILFRGEMVRAILEGRKTQTRRLVTDATSQGNWRASTLDLSKAWVDPGPSPAGNLGPYLKAPNLARGDWPEGEVVERLYPRWSVGDRLWARETWSHDPDSGAACADHLCGMRHHVRYRADEPDDTAATFAGSSRWRHSIFLPRWASRLTLELTAVRVQRIQEISEDDAKAEGIEGWHPPNGLYVYRFRELWQRVNAKRAPWESNPWLWVLTFRVVPRG